MNIYQPAPDGYEFVEAMSPQYEQPELNARKATKPKPNFIRTCTNVIMATEYPPIMWIVEDYLPEGFSVLAGRQKLGKTWLAIDWAIAVATGGFAMGSIPCVAGNVLYIDMENGPRRIKRRLEMIFPNDRTRPDLSLLEWVTEAPLLNKGFIDALDEWRLSVEHPRMIVIDVLQRIKPAGSGNRTAYENDYACFQELQVWATKHRIAVLALHHTRKGGADDPLEALNGSNGLSAVADTTLVLDRKSAGLTLYVRGRDVQEKDSALKFDDGVWVMLGEAGEVRRSNERVTILVTLENAAESMSPTELADVTGMKPGNVRKLLHAMLKAGEVLKIGRGQYVHPNNPSNIATAENPGNNGNAVTKDLGDAEI